MRILISNDDGLEAPGIQALAKEMRESAEVTVVAPHRERSSASHSLTLHKPLRLHDHGEGQYAATGSPADCIYVGLRHLLKQPPDLILSGINNGANLGTDIHYSGTVAAAREAALMKVRSYAFSLVRTDHIRGRAQEPMRWEMAARIARSIVEQTSTIEFPEHTVLNVNIPNIEESEIKGVKIAPQGFRYYTSQVEQRTCPRGKDYYWIGGGYEGFEEGRDCDCDAINEGFVSVTPITLDCTHREFLGALRDRPLSL